jgi:hypothetical protein
MNMLHLREGKWKEKRQVRLLNCLHLVSTEPKGSGVQITASEAVRKLHAYFGNFNFIPTTVTTTVKMNAR